MCLRPRVLAITGGVESIHYEFLSCFGYQIYVLHVMKQLVKPSNANDAITFLINNSI